MPQAPTFFPIGATYAPLAKATEVDPLQWPADLARFRDLGLNTFRLFICWDRVEAERGRLDFSRIDHAFELAARNELRVVANVGGTFANLQAIYPPRWLVYDCGCTLLQPNPHAPEQELRFNRFKLCYDDPVFQREAREFIRTAVARYRQHPSLIAWAGWNEPRTSECYCRHTAELFRAWLRGKYGDVATLGAAWSTEFPVRFRTWEDVFPQPRAGFEYGGYVPYLDWRQFIEQNRTDKFHLVRDWIREVDPATPVISHMCGPTDMDIFGQEEIAGTSAYTIHSQGKRGDFSPYEFTYRYHIPFCAVGRRKHRKDAEGFWLVETEAGPVTWVHDLIPRSYSPRQMNARDMLFVAHGARALLRWLYRSRISDAQAGEFNLVAWDGRITDRASAFGELARFLNLHADRMTTHVGDRSGVLILFSRDLDAMSEAEGYGMRYWRSLHYLQHAFQHIGVQAEFCNVRQILEGALDDARLLYIPFRPHVDPALAVVLRQFVARGGTLLAESPFATKDMRGIHYEVTPGNLVDVFGAQVYDMNQLQEPTCGGIPAFDFRAGMEAKGGTVEASFADGAPAIVSNTYGKGRAVLYGSVLSEAYQLERPLDPPSNPRTLTYAEGGPFRAELLKRVAGAGIQPAWRLDDVADEAIRHIHVLVRRVPATGERLIFVLNMDTRPNAFTLSFDGAATATELGSSESGPACEPASGKLRFRLAEWGWCVLVCPSPKRAQ